MRLSATEWREIAMQLATAADASAAAGRRTAPNLARLAEFCSDNAELVERGHTPLWPPPPWSGDFGAVLAGATLGLAPDGGKRDVDEEPSP